MAGGQLGSPNCDGVVLNSFNSPRFDISEFLKTPKDSNPEEPFFNFAGFNIPTPTFNLLTPLPPFNSRRSQRGEGSEADFSTLLFDKGVVGNEGTSVDDTLNGELIAFDEIDADIAKDSFALFSGTHENFLNHPISPLRINVPCHPSAGSRLPLNFPPPMFTQGSYFGGEPGGLMEVEDRALAIMEQGASTSGGANPLICPNTPMVWSVPRDGALQSNSTQQPNTLQCDSCQILRRIIHSNGLPTDTTIPNLQTPTSLPSLGCQIPKSHRSLYTTPLNQHMNVLGAHLPTGTEI